MTLARLNEISVCKISTRALLELDHSTHLHSVNQSCHLPYLLLQLPAIYLILGVFFIVDLDGQINISKVKIVMSLCTIWSSGKGIFRILFLKIAIYLWNKFMSEHSSKHVAVLCNLVLHMRHMKFLQFNKIVSLWFHDLEFRVRRKLG